jgi:hypothetical protein
MTPPCGVPVRLPLPPPTFLERLSLTLNEVKTRVVDTFEGRFDFLGFEIRMGKSRRTGNDYAHVQPSKKALRSIKDRVTVLTREGGGHSCRLTGWSKKSTPPCGDGLATFTFAIAAKPSNMFGVTSSSECGRISASGTRSEIEEQAAPGLATESCT